MPPGTPNAGTRRRAANASMQVAKIFTVSARPGVLSIRRGGVPSPPLHCETRLCEIHRRRENRMDSPCGCSRVIHSLPPVARCAKAPSSEGAWVLKPVLFIVSPTSFPASTVFIRKKNYGCRKLGASLPPSDEGGGFCRRQKPEGEKRTRRRATNTHRDCILPFLTRKLLW